MSTVRLLTSSILYLDSELGVNFIMISYSVCCTFYNLCYFLCHISQFSKKIKTEGRGCKLAKYCFEKEKKILITNNEVQKDVTQYYSCAEKKRTFNPEFSVNERIHLGIEGKSRHSNIKEN